MYKIVRENDKKTVYGNVLKSVRFLMPARENVVTEVKKPVVGENVYLANNITLGDQGNSLTLLADYWLTTEVTEILEDTKEFTKFTTENSNYIIYYNAD